MRIIHLLLMLFCVACEKNSTVSEEFIKDNPVISVAPLTDSVGTTVWECDGVSITVQTLAETAWVYFRDSVYELRQAPAASGARFTGTGGEFRNKGHESRFTLGDSRFDGCRLNKPEGSWEAARLRGMDFRGLGQEPGWLLEVFKDDSIVFLADYGTRRIVTPYVDPQIANEKQIVYTTKRDTVSLQITVVRDSCTDIMSGFRFPATVRVRLNERRYEGCGRDL